MSVPVSTSSNGDEPIQPAPARMRRLWLVRHGESQANREKRFDGHFDTELTALGEVQAKEAGKLLCAYPIVACFASDLRRTRRTAELACAQFSQRLPIDVSPNWRELYFGAWEGLTYQEIVELSPQDLNFFTDNVRHAPLHGETHQSLVARVQTALRDVAVAAHTLPEGDLMLVSHGGTISVLISLVLGIPSENWWKLRLNNASLSAIDFYPDDADIFKNASLFTLNQLPTAQSLTPYSDQQPAISIMEDIISHG